MYLKLINANKTHLWNYGELVSKLMQADCLDVDVVDADRACALLQDAEEAESDAALAGASSTHDADLLAGANVRIEANKHVLQVFAVFDRVVGQLNVTLLWPLGRRLGRLVDPLFLFDLLMIFVYILHAYKLSDSTRF